MGGTTQVPFSGRLRRPSKKKEECVGTPQTPAGRTLHPLGKGVALKLMPMGDTPIGINLSGSKGRCPLKTPCYESSRIFEEPLVPLLQVTRGGSPLAGFKGCP